jgi:hypothetical protein
MRANYSPVARQAAFDLADEDENGVIDTVEFRRCFPFVHTKCMAICVNTHRPHSLELILVEAGFNSSDVEKAFVDMDADR